MSAEDAAEAVTLTNATQVRALTPETAALHLPVTLQGVVLLEGHDHLVVADDTSALFLEDTNGRLSVFKSGDRLQVNGFSDPSKFAPIVKVSAAKKVGEGPLPPPRKVTYPELASGCLDAQWVEVSGIVRRSEGNAASMEGWNALLATGGGKLPLRMSAAQGKLLAVDSEVTVRGVCFYLFNKSRQALSPRLSIPACEPIVVIQPPLFRTEAMPVRRISTLMQFSAADVFTHRVRVHGVVSYVVRDRGFWISDGSRGLRVFGLLPDSLAAGDEVDVWGFLNRGDYAPVLEDAIYSKTGHSGAPSPVLLTEAQQALEQHGNLIQIDATILDRRLTFDGYKLTLQSGQTQFPALLPSPTADAATEKWKTGSRVRLTGMCLLTFGDDTSKLVGTLEPQSFQVLLRSPADLVILQSPPWWTVEHVAWLLAGLVCMLSLAMGTVFLTGRRRLRLQAIERVKSEAEFAAVFNERNRMARELHDTLAQGLGAISMQLEVVKRKLTPGDDARKSLEVASELARSNLNNARNAIWNMRSQALESNDLATVLGEVLRNLTEGTKVKGEMRTRGPMRRLPPTVENDLLFIGQEAITNAAKYSQAGNIQVILEYEDRQLRLSITDDGKGFDATRPPRRESGFGLLGMKERAAQLHATLAVTSEPGEGTIVTLEMPLNQLHSHAGS